MLSAVVWIDEKTGFIKKGDSLFLHWISGNHLAETHIDELFKTANGESLYHTVTSRIENNSLQYINVVPVARVDAYSRMLCLIDFKDNTEEESTALRFIPIAKPGEPEEFSLDSIPPQVFDAITDFIFICSPDYTIKKINRAGKAVFGGLEKLEGKKCYEVLRDRNSPCDDCPLPKTLLTGKMVPTEYYDHNLREYMELRTYPDVNPDGEFTDFTLISRIVSKRREQEGETAQSKKLQALGQMASGIAHDFNNMLTIILGRVQLLKSKLDDTGMLSNLKTIEKAALDSTDIIQRLQDFTRRRDPIDTGKYESIDMNSVIQDVVNYATTRIERLRKQEGIHIQIETQLREIDRIDGNVAQLRSSLLNVVLNAIDALEIGGIITIWTQQLGARIEIGVVDTGIGMSNEVQEKIFDPFFTTKGSKGNGLGLSEVYGIVNQHSGEIKIESSPGEGTTMLFYFPISFSQ